MRSAARAERDEPGAATVLGVALMGLLVVVAVVASAVVALVACHRRAQSAADLAALAGGAAAVRGADPCAEAGRIAARNGARLAGCEVVGADVAVVVAVPAPALPGIDQALLARARAGPAKLSSAE